MKKIRPVKNNWYKWLIIYSPEPITKCAGRLKDRILNALEEKTVGLFKINAPKETVYGRGQKLSKPRKRLIKKPCLSEENKEKIKDGIIRDISKLFETGEEKEQN